MADSKLPGAAIGPPIGPPGRPQFQMPQPGPPQPNLGPARPGMPGTQPQFRPGVGLTPRQGMTPSPQPGIALPPQPSLHSGAGQFSQTSLAFPPRPGITPSPQPASIPTSNPGITPSPQLGPGSTLRPGMPVFNPHGVTPQPRPGTTPPPPRPGISPSPLPGMGLPQSLSQSSLTGGPATNGQNSLFSGQTTSSYGMPPAPPVSQGQQPLLRGPSLNGPPTSEPNSYRPPPMGHPGPSLGPGPMQPLSRPTLNGPTSTYGAPPPMNSGPQPGMPPPPPSMQTPYTQSQGINSGVGPPMMGQQQFSNQTPMPSSNTNGPYSGMNGPMGPRPGMPPPPPSMQTPYSQSQGANAGAGPPMMGQQSFSNQSPLPPPNTNGPYSGMNGPTSHMPPPPMSSGNTQAPNMMNSKGPGSQPMRPSGMPPPIQNQPQTNAAGPMNGMNSRLAGLSLHSGMEPVDLLQNRHILPPKSIPAPRPRLSADIWNSVNCSPDIFRCTLTKVPETETLLKKARLPLGILIHPFKDLSHLPVIQCSTIVRCRQCRTYINPFVTFVDQRRWRCNICYRVNELPEEFLYDPVSKSYGDPSRRPECKSSTIEFIAPSEYMLRPPQPAVYVFCLDTSRQAVDTGYLKVFCDVLLDELDKLPGDARTQVAFITYDRSVHFYSMSEGAHQPTQLTVSDIDDIFLPSPSDLLVNLHESRSLIIQLLEELPNMFTDTPATESALGAALQAAFKLSSPTGGRITVFQHILPKIGPGALPNREVATDSKSSSDSSLLGPVNDFYKKMSLDCSGQQIAVDLFAMGSQYQDLATLSGMSKFSAGQIQFFPGYHTEHNKAVAAKFETALRRYLTRKIGFEAVLRVRCTRGLSLHTFHGNFFVRSTDLLSLANINPDAGFGIQVAIEDDLRDSREVSFQAALLYTSSKGERRIRVHTLCLPTTANLNDVINGADQQAIVGMLTKFAADRAVSDSLSDAKEGLVVSCVDTIETYRTQASMSIPNGLLISPSLKLLPIYVLACLRSIGFRPGTRLDERSFSFSQFKSLPLLPLLQSVYPDLYRVDNLSEDGALHEEGGDSSDEDGPTEIIVPQPDKLQLSFERISATGMYLLDLGDMFFLYLSRGLHAYVLEKCFGVTRLQDINEGMTELPELENAESEKLRTFVQWLNGQKPFPAPIKIIREDGKSRHLFVERMIEDRMDNSFSYFEFLQHIKQQIK